MLEMQNIFQRKKWIVTFALIAVISWGMAFPLIKIGFQEFAIANNDTAGKTLFAGVRFLGAGILTLLVAKGNRCSFEIKGMKNWGLLLVYGLINTALHYFCFYVVLSNCSGSKSAILDAMSTFLLIVFACMYFPDEHITRNKIVGCLLGISGIVILNIGNVSGTAFSLAGEGMLFLNSVFSAIGGILTRIVTKKVNAIVATGISLSAGGIMLILLGVGMQGTVGQITPLGIIVLFLLMLVSVVGFTLYNQLLCYNPVSEIAIFNALIPIWGAILSCIILGETFYVKYILAGILVALGVYTVNRL